MEYAQIDKMKINTRNFIAIDFETANYEPNNACEIGLVRVVKGTIVSEHSFRIRPPRDEFVPHFTKLHGISFADVKYAPTFKELWPNLKRILSGVEFLAAHNASFDQNVLAASCGHYGITLPRLPFLCSMATARDLWSIRPTRLPDVCKTLEIQLGTHHRGLDDARACARIILRASEEHARVASLKLTGIGKQLELLPPVRKSSTVHGDRKLSTSARTKLLGNWGERIIPNLLLKAGFENVEDLNDRITNHPFADFLASRNGKRYLIGVKTRNKLTSRGVLNSTYNVRKKGKNLKPLAKEYKAKLAWVTIQVEAERQRYSAYFGTVAQIEEKGERFSIPMTEARTANYECLARNEIDRSIRPEWSNQTGTKIPVRHQKERQRASRSKLMPPRPPSARKSDQRSVSDAASELLGFRPGTKTHRAVSMYLRPDGATTAEIVKVNGGPYLNCLKQVEAMGHTVERQRKLDNEGKLLTSYRIILR